MFDDKELVIAPSALKHGVLIDDMLLILSDYVVKVDEFEEDPCKTLFLGFDRTATVLEVIVVEIYDEYVKVIHAMKATDNNIRKYWS